MRLSLFLRNFLIMKNQNPNKAQRHLYAIVKLCSNLITYRLKLSLESVKKISQQIVVKGNLVPVIRK